MFKKLILSLPFVKGAIQEAIEKNIIANYPRITAFSEIRNELTMKSAELASLDAKYQLSLNDLQEKYVQIHSLTRALDTICDHFIPEKEQPSPLQYKDIPQLIINKCSQKTKSKKPKSKAKKTK